MKKRLSILTIFALLATYSFGQLSAVDYNSEEFTRFKASKTYVVKTGNEKFDEAIETAMKDMWTVTKFEVIDKPTFDAKITDKTASFILSVVIETGTPNQNYHYLALVNGGVKKVSKFTYDDMLAYAVINHFQSEPENVDCAYRVSNMLASMIDAMNIVKQNDIRGNSKKIATSLLDYYKTKAPKIKDRTLLIPDYVINKKFEEADISKVYPYKYEVCSKEKIAKAIKEKSKDYYYFQPTITLNKSVFVFDPSNGDVLYGNVQVMGLNIKDSDFESLTDAIKGKK